MSLSVRLYGNLRRAKELVSLGMQMLNDIKLFMSFQDLKQLAPTERRLPDGSAIKVKSIFGIDIVTILGAGGEVIKKLIKEVDVFYVFLITSSSNYVVWEIKKNNIIEPYELDISKYVTVNIASTIDIVTPSTIQSNKVLNRHQLYLDTMWDTAIKLVMFDRKYGLVSYEKDLSNNWQTILFGNRNSYTPNGWGTADPLLYIEDNSFMSYPNVENSSPPSYICSGRHNWIYNGDEVYKNLEVWAINSTTAQIRYETKTGT